MVLQCPAPSLWPFAMMLLLEAAHASMPLARSWGLRPANASTSAAVSVSKSEAIVVTLQLGTPPQTLRCLVDSGSSDLWVPSRRCTNCHIAGKHFNAEASETFWPEVRTTAFGLQPSELSLRYGSGTVRGYKVEDTLSIGSVTVKNQSFLIVEQVDIPSDAEWDGILGLGWEGLAEAGTPLYKKIAALGVKPIFTFAPQGEHTGFLSLGSVPKSAVRPGSLAWVSATATSGLGISSPTFWMAQGGLAIHRKTPRRTRYLVDTGTNFLLVPPKDYEALMMSLIPADVFQDACFFDQHDGLAVCLCEVASNPRLLPLRFYLGDGRKKAFVLEMGKLFLHTGDMYRGKPLCLLEVQPNQLAQQSAMQQPFVDAVPISTPAAAASGAAAPPSSGVTGGATGAASSTGIMESSEITTLEDGTVCRTITVVEDGQVKKNVTECDHTQRRLQMADPMEDTWILGGVFLDHFVVVFDFENKRLGVAYPSRSMEASRMAMPKSTQRKWQIADGLDAKVIASAAASIQSSAAGVWLIALLAGLVVPVATIIATLRSGRKARHMESEPSDEEGFAAERLLA